MREMKCPACGAPVRSQITSRIVVCEYCDTQLVLDADMADAIADASNGELDEYEVDFSQWDSMPQFASDACSQFLAELGSERFSVTEKIYGGLGIDGNEEVYLIHDDSMFGRGKNGFAITKTGLYCREMGEPAAILLDWDSFAQYDQPYADGSYIAANGVYICYYTDDSDLIPYLLDLYCTLHAASRYMANRGE